ncbi:MAG: LysM peptidoglycan-binding domain-containing protein, partial [Anaerolineae bacterium]|nr:LysM peptidoglycan-binding domain-containing protein [Anaerolineae bacterium]
MRAGDTLLRIAAAYGTTVESLMAINGLADADQLRAGQVLKVTMEASYTGPARILLPDSELVYGPSYADFDVAAAIASSAGYLIAYTETVNGTEMTGPEIIELVAVQYSIGPRVLLALLELRGSWLSNPTPTAEQQAYPLGYQVGAYWEGLFRQLCQAANGLNAGFYGWWDDTSWLVQTADGVFIQYSADLNAGTAAVQKMTADTSATYESWVADLDRFSQVYQELFGDPFQYGVEPLIPP